MIVIKHCNLAKLLSIIFTWTHKDVRNWFQTSRQRFETHFKTGTKGQLTNNKPDYSYRNPLMCLVQITCVYIWPVGPLFVQLNSATQASYQSLNITDTCCLNPCKLFIAFVNFAFLISLNLHLLCVLGNNCWCVCLVSAVIIVVSGNTVGGPKPKTWQLVVST